MDRNQGCAPKIQYNASRLLYLREKLRECLQDKEFAHLPIDQSRSDQRATSFKHTSSNNCSRTSASVCGSEYGNSGGLVKPRARPLTWHTHDRRTQRPRTPEMETVLTDLLDEPGDLLDKLLAAFPTLNLDGHDTRVLRRKAAKLLGACSSRPTSLPAISPSNRHKLTWVEERNRRRLAQLLRHSMRMSRFRDQKTADEEDRRLKAQLQERRHQLIRIRNYYQQFVSDFRAKKMAKVFEEEKVFRNFFQGFLAQERENLMDIQKLEREERNKSRILKEEQMANLEYTRRARMALLKERLEQEEAQRTNSERQQRLELIKQRRELRHMLETNVRELQRNMLENHDSVYFREKDASRMLQH
ncbi:centrosomal protein of 95 kDa [Clonorchis sinensis]|nr:centrosomal protein of 95 kDa [Clonorchis sinensis]